MGRIKELRDLVAKGEATEEEQAELTELEGEAQEGSSDPVVEAENVDAEVDKLADQLVTKATDRLEAAISKAIGSAQDKTPVSTGKLTHSPVYIVDKQFGKITTDELSDKKFTIEDRKRAGKSTYEVSGKTVAFLNAMIEGDRQKLQLLTEGTGATGGYVVPEEFANMIVEDRRDQSVMRGLATQMTTSTDTLHIPTLDSRPYANWRSEAAVKATSTVTFGELVLTPYSLASIVGLSQELSMDASLGVGGSIINYVAGLMTRALVEKEEQASWTGNGSGKPTGITNYSVASVSAGGDDSGLADAIKRMYWRLPQGFRRSAVWVGHQQAWERVNITKDSNKNYLLTRIADGPTVTLQGRPVYEQNDLPTDQLFFGDFSQYFIVDRQGITVDFSTEATVGGSNAFEKNLVFVRVEERVDAELAQSNAIRRIIDMN